MKVLPIVVICALALTGCVPAYVENSAATVLMIIATVHGGLVLDSDVAISTGGICPDNVDLDIAIRAKNQNPSFNPVNIPMHVLIERYEVRYFRSDGRGTEGVDVPYRISGGIATEVDVATSGTSPVRIEVVRRQAKIEPPLVFLNQNFRVVTMFAEITIHGRTISGQGLSSSAVLQIDFADFGDDLESCPPNQ